MTSSRRSKIARTTAKPRQPRRTTEGLPPPTPSERRFEAMLRAFLVDDASAAEDAASNATPLAPPVRDALPAPSVAATTNVAIELTDERVALATSYPVPDEGTAAHTASDFIGELFARRAEFLDRDPYATIGDAYDFNTKVVGVSFEGRQELVAGLATGDLLELVRVPDNEHDPNAIAVRYGALHLGYVRREIAKRIAANIDGGERYKAWVTAVTGGNGRHVGVNIKLRRERPAKPPAQSPRSARTGDEEAIRQALIGDRTVREAQTKVLSRVASGANTLAVMGTGRGKSFCYQLPAATRALAERRKTLALYPLRALANDQYEALLRRLAPFDLRILRANGSIDGEARAQLETALETGEWDVVLSTPEFVQFHGDAFRRPCNRPALVVVDEAHHLFESRHRPAYAALGSFIATLGPPQVLALTATAGDEAFADIRTRLNIDAWVIDPTVRENLHLIDARGTADKNAYLLRVLDPQEKAIVYCNSRSDATNVAEALRGDFGDTVAFYHAGMGHELRVGVEERFREGAVRTIIATSAFGEGIDLPDVRDVVIYHLNFNFTEFNQQAGRAGRDGAAASIHLLYGERDRALNEFILSRTNPSIETLREIYRGLRGLASQEFIRLAFEDVARTLDLTRVNGETIGAAALIFAEAGLLESGRDEEGRYLRLRPDAPRVDLSKTVRFAEGLAERSAFDDFCSLALRGDVATLEQIVNRPIYPQRVRLEN